MLNAKLDTRTEMPDKTRKLQNAWETPQNAEVDMAKKIEKNHSKRNKKNERRIRSDPDKTNVTAKI